MSQHDGTIGNDTGANTRSDIQNAIQAAFSTHKGNSRPATAYQGQLWIDDNTPSSTLWTLNLYTGTADIPVGFFNLTAGGFWPYISASVVMRVGQNATDTPGSGNTQLGGSIAGNGSAHFSNNGAYVVSINRNSNGQCLIFGNGGTSVGNIAVSGSSTAYNTSSDRRLKENIEPIAPAEALALLDQLNPVFFTWKAAPGGPRVDGFIADELQAVLPHAVTGAPDAARARLDEGTGDIVEEIIPQGVDQGKLTPILTAVCKALLAEVTALKARVDQLEGGA